MWHIMVSGVTYVVGILWGLFGMSSALLVFVMVIVMVEMVIETVMQMMAMQLMVRSMVI